MDDIVLLLVKFEKSRNMFFSTLKWYRLAQNSPFNCHDCLQNQKILKFKPTYSTLKILQMQFPASEFQRSFLRI